MSDQNTPSIRIEKISLERIGDVYEAVIESGKEWFAEGMIDKSDTSMDGLETSLKGLMELWEKDVFYMFYILDGSTDQFLGLVFLNHINRTHQIANLGYMVQTRRAGQGIATEAVKLAARYGFEKLGLQRIEIVVRPDNPGQPEGRREGGRRARGAPAQPPAAPRLPTRWLHALPDPGGSGHYVGASRRDGQITFF